MYLATSGCLQSVGSVEFTYVCSFFICYNTFRMKRSYFFTVLLIAIAVISIIVLIIKIPEESSVVSQDGLVTVSGLARQSQQFIISTPVAKESNILFGSVYKIEPSMIALEEPATISWIIKNAQPDLGVQLYYFDQDLEMWTMVNRVIDRADGLMVVEVDQLGFFTLGTNTPLLDLPDFDDQLLSIIELAPENTVGYEMAVAYDYGLGPLIQISETVIGGCGGVVEIGNSEEISQVEYLSYSIIARWFVSDLAGCDLGKNLEPSF